MPKEDCDHLAVNLNKRLSSGEEFTEKIPAIAAKPGYERRGYNKRKRVKSWFVSTRNISRIIKDAMRPRFKGRPYVLRAYFDTQMLLAERGLHRRYFSC